MILGGESQTRNKNILKMFSLANIGERAGSGFLLILSATEESGIPTPVVIENNVPLQSQLIFYIKKDVNFKKSSENLPIGDSNLQILNPESPLL